MRVATPLAATHAGVGHTPTRLFLLKYAGQGAHQTHAGDSQGMTQGGASALYVDPLRVQPQLLNAVEGHDAERPR